MIEECWGLIGRQEYEGRPFDRQVHELTLFGLYALADLLNDL